MGNTAMVSDKAVLLALSLAPFDITHIFCWAKVVDRERPRHNRTIQKSFSRFIIDPLIAINP
jgi:hypothetical protein